MEILSSYKTTMTLLGLYAIALTVATFVEKSFGTMLAKIVIYYSPLFFLLQFLLTVNFVMIAIKRRWWKFKRWGLLLLHASFIIILSGAFITHVSGKEGILHLREGEISSQIQIQTNRGDQTLTLPFQVELVKFTLARYPGSMSPSSYESELLIHIDGTKRHERVYMNNVLNVKGYRFFQASFDEDEKGTVLSVNKDVAGQSITYAGYALLFVGSILSLIGKNGRIHILYKRLNHLKTASGIVLLVLLFGFSEQALADETAQSMTGAVQKLVIPPTHAERFGALPVQSVKGRIIPMNTLSSELLRKLYKNTRFGALNSDQFLLSLLVMPEMWAHVPIMIHSNDALADYFSFPHEACSYLDLFREDGTYKLGEKLEEAYHKMPAARTGFDKAVIQLDDKANILNQLFEYQLIRLFPHADDPNQKWYAPGDDLSTFAGQDSLFVSKVFYRYLSEVQSALKSGDWSKANEALDSISTYQTEKNNVPDFDKGKIALEQKYNQLDIFRWCKTGYLLLGGLLLLFSFALFFRNKTWIRWTIRILGIMVFIVFLFQMLGMGMRWKIAGYAPWSNSYETMIFMAWTAALAGLVFVRRSSIVFSLGALFAGIILFVSGLNWMDPQINPLVPVLKSPWLMFHVAILMAAYGFFGISFLLGLVNLLIMALIPKEKQTGYLKTLQELSVINEIALIIGLILMTIGTFMGAVWANESWGRYWGWDPKETWALITMIVYALVVHLHLLKKWYNLWSMNLCSVIAFASVLMTYFGVNYFLSGMHSYGQNDSVHGFLFYLLGAGIIIALLAGFAWKGKKFKTNISAENTSRLP